MSTPQNLLDLAGSLLVNRYATGRAVSSGTLRDPLMADRDSVWTDKRFALGVLGAGVSTFAKNDTIKRIGLDLGGGALHSLIATEAVRSATVARAQALASPVAAPAAAPRQIPAGIASPVGSPVRVGFGSVW